MNMPREELVGAVDDLLRDILTNYLRPPTPSTREMNVTMGQMDCLHTLSRLGNPTMSELAQAMHLHPSTVTVLVDGLVAHGLVSRQADPRDRRIVRVAETPKGRRDRERHLAHMRGRVTNLLSELSDEDLDRIYSSLWALREAAQRKVETTSRRGGPASGRKEKKTS